MEDKNKEGMELEKAISRCKQLVDPTHAQWIGISNQEAIDTALAELEKYKSVKLDENDRLTSESFTKEQLNYMNQGIGFYKLFRDEFSIPKSKIEKKIEELKKALKKEVYNKYSYYQTELEYGIKIFKELLEEEK